MGGFVGKSVEVRGDRSFEEVIFVNETVQYREPVNLSFSIQLVILVLFM